MSDYKFASQGYAGLGQKFATQAPLPFLIQGFSGLQPLIQQAMQDFGMSYSDYGIKGKGKKEGKSKDRAQGKQSSGKGTPENVKSLTD